MLDHARTTFGSRDVEKVHAVVARSTFPSQKCQNLRGSDHFWTFRCRFAWQAQGILHLVKSEQMVRVLLPLHQCATRHDTTITLHYNNNYNDNCNYKHKYKYNYTTLTTTTTTTSTTLHELQLQLTTTLQYTTLNYTRLHSIKSALHHTQVHYTTLHYNYTYNYNYTTLHYPNYNDNDNYNYTMRTTTTTTTLQYTTLHYTTLCFTLLHYTTLHYTTLKYTTLELHLHLQLELQLQLRLQYATTTTTLPYATLITWHYATLYSIPLHSTPLIPLHSFHSTRFRSAPLHYTNLNYSYGYKYNYATYIARRSLHHHKSNCNCYTTPQLQLHCATTTTTALYATVRPAVVSEVTTATIAATPKNTAPTTFGSISGFTLPSVIHNSQAFPMVSFSETSAAALHSTGIFLYIFPSLNHSLQWEWASLWLHWTSCTNLWVHNHYSILVSTWRRLCHLLRRSWTFRKV